MISHKAPISLLLALAGLFMLGGDSDVMLTTRTREGSGRILQSVDLASRIESAAEKMILTTPVLPITGHSERHADFVKFHLRCLASLASQTAEISSIAIYATDKAVIEYIDESDFPLQAVMINPSEEQDFGFLVRRMGELWPEAASYGFMNGDICPSISIIETVNQFNTANCPSEKDDFTRWRFATTVRWNVYLNRFDEPTAQKDALAHVEKTHLKKRNRYGLRGVDFFAWNREYYHEHIVPSMPSFTLPLFIADHYLLHDASCNALVLMTEESVPSAKLYHLTTSRERDWNRTADPSAYNRKLANNARGVGWARESGECSWDFARDMGQAMMGIYGAGACHYQEPDASSSTFECFEYGVGTCTVPEDNRIPLLARSESEVTSMSKLPRNFEEPELTPVVSSGTLRGLPLVEVVETK